MDKQSWFLHFEITNQGKVCFFPWQSFVSRVKCCIRISNLFRKLEIQLFCSIINCVCVYSSRFGVESHISIIKNCSLIICNSNELNENRIINWNFENLNRKASNSSNRAKWWLVGDLWAIYWNILDWLWLNRLSYNIH